MLASFFGTDSLYVVIIAIVVLFGGSQLPKLARNAGEAMREFRKSHNDMSQDTATVVAPAAPAPVAQPPAALPATAAPVAPSATAAAADERVTLTRGELDALLADRENRAKATTTQDSQK
jgi:sec-independent protein translocase protein TatA